MRFILKLLMLTMMILPAAAQTTLADRPVAVINLHRTEVIPQSKYEQYLNVMQLQNNGQELTMDEKKAILDVLINQLLVKQDAASRGISVDEEQVLQMAMQQLSMELAQAGLIPQGAILTDQDQFNQLLSSQGMNPDLYIDNIRNNLLIQAYIMQTRQDEFRNLEAPSDRDIRNYYNANIAMFAIPEYVQIRQIFFNTTEEGADLAAIRGNAQDLMRRLESGALTFDEALITEGDLFPLLQTRESPIFIAQGDGETMRVFGETFANGLFEEKTIGRPYFMESNVGFHIVVVDEKADADVRTLADTISPVQSETVRDFIVQVLYSSSQQALYAQLQQQVVIDLRELAGEEGVRIFEEAIR